MNEKYFNEIGIEDEFFDSLKYDYPGFENWFVENITKKLMFSMIIMGR